MDKAERFGPRLRELRLRKQWTQKDLASRVGLPVGTVSRFEQGALVPIWTKAVLLADALGVSLDAFTENPRELPPQHRGRPPQRKQSNRRADRAAKSENPKR
jgi:transcriptional regulator with XRE-family HTH domain